VSWYNLGMAAQKPKRSLPAGVVPAKKPWSDEDPGSHVRPKAPEAQQRNEMTPNDTPATRARVLVKDLVKLAPDSVAPVLRRLLPLGKFALEEIARQFPGPLWRPSLATDSRLPNPAEISATAAALAAFGSEAVPYLSRLMRSPNTPSRYYATVICAAYADPRLIEPLAQVALDEDRECRRVALHLLSAYQHERRYHAALGQMRRLASDIAQPLEIRRRAISALTQLRDEASAMLFVELLADSDRGITTASRVGLRVLTAHDFGFSRAPWLRWLSDRGHELRIRWLIEGLGDSRANIRLLASRELWTLTRFLQPLSETAGREEFLEAQQHYDRWWSQHHPD
jgi:hypothetical protein